jgi:hypothetical protein
MLIIKTVNGKKLNPIAAGYNPVPAPYSIPGKAYLRLSPA